jgi:cytochrome c oxidase subunit 2
MKTKFLYLLVLATVIISACNQQPTTAPGASQVSLGSEKGKQLFVTCIACHGKNGEGIVSLGAPSISQQEDWYIIRQLTYFRDGVRGVHPEDIKGATMVPMVKNLSDTDIKEVVAYTKTLTPLKPEITINGDIENGKKLYTSICLACHGSDGSGDPKQNSPKLTGLQDWYLKTQIVHFRNGVRGTHPQDKFGPLVVPMVKKLKDEKEIDDVISYINTLSSI